MKIPYVIDNQTYRLVDVLRELLAGHAGKSLDVATAYFTVAAFDMLKDGLGTLGNFRLLLGAEPHTGEQIGLRPDARVLAAQHALAAIRFLGTPALSVIIKELRIAYRAFQKDGDAGALLRAVLQLAETYGQSRQPTNRAAHRLRREDLRFVCFDHLCS